MESLCDTLSCRNITDYQHSSSIDGGRGGRTEVMEKEVQGSKKVGERVLLGEDLRLGGQDHDADDDTMECVEEGVEDTEDNYQLAFSLVGKLRSNRVPNPNAFITTMKHGLEISNIGRNLLPD